MIGSTSLQRSADWQLYLAYRLLPFSLNHALIFLAVFASFLEMTGSASAQSAQSTYRFVATPEFMLLSRYTKTGLWGYTASLWDKEQKSVVFGEIEKPNAIKLEFFPISSDVPARDMAFKSDDCRSFMNEITDQCFARLEEAFRKVAGPTVRMREYIFQSDGSNGGAWTTKEEPSNLYSSFAIYRDHDLDSLEAQLRPGTKKLGQTPEELGQTAVDNLFGGLIVREYAGLQSSQLKFTTQSCGHVAETLESTLQAAGKWEVTVEPEYEETFRVELKSHSDRELFYTSGVWWKAYFEVSFHYQDGNGTCSGATVYMYDSETCGAPLADDPDVLHRQCFQRIPVDSNAEYVLRDRLSQILAKKYSTTK
ncbi:hypothetical protein ELH72_08585 [Rhizobium ruizarguesonis]|jgi:hypothetical protein|uniref:hypothetical protein n=1 Tax=Rhizobium ruizarguesonis TaxID=2081791 RepID=UPI00103146A0|nr:hypothetical protein [Rhizobium ruizarguesonis]TAZ83316.1 hypothetical protein ELH72_08585 [Rhizobium ruizarguesonis]